MYKNNKCRFQFTNKLAVPTLSSTHVSYEWIRYNITGERIEYNFLSALFTVVPCSIYHLI